MPSDQQAIDMTVIPTATLNRLIGTLDGVARAYEDSATDRRWWGLERAAEIRKIIAEVALRFSDGEATADA